MTTSSSQKTPGRARVETFLYAHRKAGIGSRRIPVRGPAAGARGRCRPQRADRHGISFALLGSMVPLFFPRPDPEVGADSLGKNQDLGCERSMTLNRSVETTPGSAAHYPPFLR